MTERDRPRAVAPGPPTANAAHAAIGADPSPSAPTIRGALRTAATDLYYHAIRLVPINAVFALGVLAVTIAWAAVGPLFGLAGATLLAIPVAGLARLGGLVVRKRDVNLSDAFDPVRSGPLVVVGAGGAFVGASAVLMTNLAVGLLSASPLGMALATLAFWGLLAVNAFGYAFWPLLVDPDRDHLSTTDRARLAALLVIAHPVRLGVLTLSVSAILLASIVLFAAFLTIGVAFVILVACRYVLPAADRLTQQMPSEPDA